MSKTALHINEILVVPEQLWWRLEVRLAAVFDKFVQQLVRFSARWQTRVQGCHGSTMILRDVEQ
jgi:5-methylcytosine-specific restriction endonuclease McrBC regulatory subunit McrC